MTLDKVISKLNPKAKSTKKLCRCQTENENAASSTREPACACTRARARALVHMYLCACMACALLLPPTPPFYKLFFGRLGLARSVQLTAPSHGDGSLLLGSLLVYGSSSSSSSSSQNANSLNKSTQRHATKIERLSIF